MTAGARHRAASPIRARVPATSPTIPASRRSPVDGGSAAKDLSAADGLNREAFMLKRVFAILVVAAALASPVCASRPAPKHAANHPGPAVARDFALTALQHLKGPAQRPFLDLLKSLPPPSAQPGVTISIRATKNLSCSGGVCTPTAAKATLNVYDLTRLLVDGSVTIATTAEAPDIFVNAPFSWTSGNGLTLQAIGN